MIGLYHRSGSVKRRCGGIQGYGEMSVLLVLVGEIAGLDVASAAATRAGSSAKPTIIKQSGRHADKRSAQRLNINTARGLALNCVHTPGFYIIAQPP